jgi:hypothetical protein
MLSDVLGRSRATLTQSASFLYGVIGESNLPAPAPDSRGLGNLLNCVVLGIDDCNYSS